MADIVLTIPDALLPTYQRFQTENGVTWAASYIIEKLKELVERHLLVDQKTVYDAYKLLPKTQQDTLKLL